MPINPKNAKKSLAEKGFKPENRDHNFWFYYHEGKKTNCYTYFSFGSNKEIDDSLLKKMRKELQLDYIKQARELFSCPLEQRDLITILRKKGCI